MTKKIITSAQNSIVKEIKELQAKKSKRKKEGLFVIEGLRGVKEIPMGTKLKYLVTTEDIKEEQISELNAGLWIEVPKEIYKTMSDTQSPQGVMAVAYMPDVDLEALSLEKGHYLVLENLQDPGNLGTIIRTAHAFDFKGVFITKGSVDLYSPKVVRATMSALFGVPIILDESIEKYMAFLKNAGVPIYTTALRADAKPIKEIVFEEQVTIIIGNEGNGVSEYVLEETDHTMIIPMPGGAESLNASVAAAICMYEVSSL